jgi:NTE family protein
MTAITTKGVALVLGAGGPVGHAFHAGVLRALHEVHGWDAREAALVVGTSAGAQVAALLRAGMSPRDLFARVTGEVMSAEGAAIARHYVRPTHAPARMAWRPSAPAFLLRALRNPRALRPGRVAAALLPAGTASMQAQVDGFQRIFGSSWPRDPTWITAVELESGESVAFGRPGAPAVDVGTAVACSGAVPALCRPVIVGARAYVDGGVASAMHLDMVPGGVAAVMAISPLSMFAPMRMLLRREVERLHRRGLFVRVFEPTGGATRHAMGLNPLDTSRAPAVARAAYRMARAQLLHLAPMPDS